MMNKFGLLELKMSLDFNINSLDKIFKNKTSMRVASKFMENKIKQLTKIKFQKLKVSCK